MDWEWGGGSKGMEMGNVELSDLNMGGLGLDLSQLKRSLIFYFEPHLLDSHKEYEYETVNLKSILRLERNPHWQEE
jgi:hypothetical protein